MNDVAVYSGLFTVAFGAATILPMQSEAALTGLLLADYSPRLLVAVASTGNVLGSVVNWLLGRGIERFRDRKWFPASGAVLARTRRWYRRYGKWSLLLSWVPSGYVRQRSAGDNRTEHLGNRRVRGKSAIYPYVAR